MVDFGGLALRWISFGTRGSGRPLIDLDSRVLALIVVMLGLVVVFFWPQSVHAQAAPPPTSGIGSIFSSLWITSPADIKASASKYQVALESMGCWPCSIYDEFANVAFTKGQSVSASAKGPLSAVIAGFGTIFALCYMGSAFVAGDASALLSRWKVFWHLCMAVALGTAVLQANAFTWAWDYVYGPVSSIPLAVANQFGGGPIDGCAGSVAASAPSGAQALSKSMSAIVCGGHKITMKGMGMAFAITTAASGIFGTIINMITGIALIAVFLWIAITFPLRFIDCLIRLMVVGILTPVLVVCAVFKPTRSYVQIGVSNVLYAAMLFAFTSIMFSLGGAFFTKIFNDQLGTADSYDPITLVGRGIAIIGSGIIFSAMLKMAPALAAEFSGFKGQSGGVGDAATGFAGSVAAAPVRAAGAGASVAVQGAVASRGGAAAGREIAGALGKGVTS